MSDKHFTLDVDPERLREVATEIAALREHLKTKSERTRAIPDEIGDDWTGDTSLYVKGEMRSLGLLMDWRMAGRLQPLPGKIRELAGAFDDALAALPSLNRRWDEAQDAYSLAITAANDTPGGTQSHASRPSIPELDDERTTAIRTAGTERTEAQNALETEFEDLKFSLRTEVGNLAIALGDAQPVDISMDKIHDYQNGDYSDADRSDLLFSLSLTRQREDLLKLQERQEQAEEDVIEDVERLNDALEDGDPEEIQSALEAMGERSDDEVYSEQLVRELGPEGVQDLYLQIDQNLSDGNLYIEELWPSLEGFNDTVAGGISSLPDEDMAPFVETFMNEDYGAKMWALIAASDNADGRVNAIALSYHSEIYNAALSQPGLSESGLFPDAFPYAFGDRADMLGQFDDRSSGSDLADVLEHASDDHIDDLMQRMHNIQTDGGTMSEGEYEHIRALYGELIVELKDRHMEALETNGAELPDVLRQVLPYRYYNSGSVGYDDFSPYIEELVTDSAFTNWWITQGNEGRVPVTELKDLIGDTDISVEQILADSVAQNLNDGASAEDTAVIIGNLLKTKDLLDDDISWNGVLKSLLDSGISAAGSKSPFTGPTLGAANALIAEIERLEAQDQAYDTSKEQNGVEAVLAVSLYQQDHGSLPYFQEFLDAENVAEDEPDAFVLYVQYMRSEREDSEAWAELRVLLSTIDVSRNS